MLLFMLCVFACVHVYVLVFAFAPPVVSELEGLSSQWLCPYMEE